ncbi:drug resistance MFS transporter, drug:H+ antiporter-2 (14 Spanner) (DHA2) family [Cedecea neteri]|uniref:Drug resistance MFS transporter, drug:H+ antiporter-2 (14 Spanner) (DHA2) family n=1 Tax=Cedecea neteri TaxID=158822 RepID=A0A2X3L290_9ENTR|nr:drug resistance MFS transporter, drug:H+ antiporter-2 (14 Spanner) (DHA2) family [Cedecea neteri]
MNALTFGLLISAISGFSQGQPGSVIIGELAALVVIGYFFIRRQLRLPFPLLPVDLLRIQFFRCLSVPRYVRFGAQMLALVSLPFFMQSVLGRSEVETGLLLTPWPLATMVMAPLAGYLIERVHAGLMGAIGLLVMACGLFALAMLPHNPSDLDIIWRMVFVWRWIRPLPVPE